jgi:SHS2 domain-containing protein
MPYSIVDHTADFGIRVIGMDMKELFLEAARALISITGAGTDVSKETLEIKSRGFDREDMLTSFLGEILFYTATRGFRISSVDIPYMSDVYVDFCMRGAYLDTPLEMNIKAVTQHDLSIKMKDGEFEVVIIFDV